MITQPSIEAFMLFPEDCLPPEGTYESRDALFEAINAWAAPRGYAFTTGRSSRSTSGRQIVTYGCDRWCRPPSTSRVRQRKTSTRGTNCPFSILAKESLNKTTWSLRHRPDRRFASHNHGPSPDPCAHPAHRKLSSKEKSIVSSLVNIGLPPRDIRTYFLQNTDSLATRQDIYNSIAESRRDLSEGQSTIDALANQQAEQPYKKAKQQIRTPVELSGSLYSTICGWISHEALQNVEEQRKRLLEGDLPSCTGSFSRLRGLPCAHTLRDLQEQGQALRLEHFHTQWHLDRSGTHHLLPEPCHRSDRVTTDSTRTQSSTQREPSALEVVEAATKPKAQSKCSRCHQLGHIMTSKVCPLRHEALLQSSAAPTAPAASTSPTAPTAPALRYDNPQAIYQRYTAAREAWYRAQPRGSIKTNQQYRKTMHLPSRYSKAEYDWCLDWKQMTKRCITPTGSREWTKEEIMAYLDWDRFKNNRPDTQAADEIV